MRDRKNEFLVGLFVAGGMVITFLVVIWLGMSNFFHQGRRYAVYFDESVQGLSIEDPVKYRGVSIGRVERIKVAADSNLIEVIVEMSPEFHFKSNLAARLKMAGITGNMFIELDQLPEGTPAASPELKFPTEFPVIASHPSDMKQMFHSLDDIVQKLKIIDIAGIAVRFQKTLDQLDQAFIDADIADLSSHIQSSLGLVERTMSSAEVPEMIDRLNDLLAQLEESLQDVDLADLSQEAKAALTNLRKESEILIHTAKPLLKDASKTVNTAGEGITNLNRQMLIVTQEMEKAAAKLNDLLDRLQDQPSQLFLGEPPPRRLD